MNLPEKWEKELYEQISEQLKSQFVKICRMIKVCSSEGDAVKHIRKLFEKMYNITKKEEGITIEIRYISSPKYMFEISAKNYKIGESFITKLVKEASKFASKNNINFEVLGECK